MSPTAEDVDRSTGVRFSLPWPSLVLLDGSGMYPQGGGGVRVEVTSRLIQVPVDAKLCCGAWSPAFSAHSSGVDIVEERVARVAFFHPTRSLGRAIPETNLSFFCFIQFPPVLLPVQ